MTGLPRGPWSETILAEVPAAPGTGGTRSIGVLAPPFGRAVPAGYTREGMDVFRWADGRYS